MLVDFTFATRATAVASLWKCAQMMSFNIANSHIDHYMNVAVPTHCKRCLRVHSTSYAFCDDDSMHTRWFTVGDINRTQTCCNCSNNFTSHWLRLILQYSWSAGRRFISRMTLSIPVFTRMWLTIMKLYWLSNVICNRMDAVTAAMPFKEKTNANWPELIWLPMHCDRQSEIFSSLRLCSSSVLCFIVLVPVWVNLYRFRYIRYSKANCVREFFLKIFRLMNTMLPKKWEFWTS